MDKRLCALLISLPCLLPGPTFAQGTILETAAFTWSENIGWVNWVPEFDINTSVCESVLFGYIWSENCGWLSLGDGTPADGRQYSNNSQEDFGVNQDGQGKLSGYAWGENIGWVSFPLHSEAIGSASVSIDLQSGKFSGFAWSENVGWLNFSDSMLVTDPGYLQHVKLDVDLSGLVEVHDLIRHLEQGNPCRVCRDWAFDFALRWRQD